LIQEYWHPDVSPRGSEQAITFYTASIDAFGSIEEFAATVWLFSHEDSLTEDTRRSFSGFERLKVLSADQFVAQWKSCEQKTELLNTDLQLVASADVSPTSGIARCTSPADRRCTTLSIGPHRRDDSISGNNFIAVEV
jgi:hypothetical protein